MKDQRGSGDTFNLEHYFIPVVLIVRLPLSSKSDELATDIVWYSFAKLKIERVQSKRTWVRGGSKGFW